METNGKPSGHICKDLNLPGTIKSSLNLKVKLIVN